MRQQKITLIVPIRVGQTDSLKALLRPIGNKVVGNGTLEFSTSPSTHFVRLVVLDRDGQHRLLFSSCYAGRLQDYVSELVGRVGVGLDAVFRHCEGYPTGAWSSAGQALQFVREHDAGWNAFVIAFPDATVEAIRASRSFRSALNSLLDRDEARPVVKSLYPRGLQLAHPAKQSADASPSRFTDFLDSLLVKKKTSSGSVIVKTNPELLAIEDRVVQNQMTVVSSIRPGFSLHFLRLVLFLAQVRNRIVGTLSGLPMIHFAQWTILDGGKNLLFESNYDGTWEKYIDDFIDNAYLGLDAIWRSDPQYPPGGARNIEAFKAGIRGLQYPAQVFYSAYPDSTVQNIKEDLALYRAFRDLAKDRAIRLFVAGSHDQQI